MKKPVLFAFALLLLASGSRRAMAATAPTPPDADAAIAELRTGLIDSFVKSDLDRLLTFLAPDVLVTWQNGEICRGPEAVRAYYQKMMTGPNAVVRAVKANPEVTGRQFYGDWAVSWGNLHDEFVLNDGRELPLNTLFTATIAKRGNRWLVTAFHASVNTFDNPVLQLAIRKTALWTGLGAGVAGLVVGVLIARRRGRQPGAAA